MLVRAKADNHLILAKTALQYDSSLTHRLGQVASAVNALMVFASFFGLLGVGVFLHTAETLVSFGGQADEFPFL